MRAKSLVAGLILIAVLACLLPASAGAQSPNVYTSIILTDILSGAPVVGGIFTTDLQVSVTNSATPEVGVLGVEVWLPFDDTVVAVDDYDGNPANGTQVEIKNGFFDGSLAIGANEVLAPDISHPTDCQTMSCVHIAVSHTGGSGPVTNKSGTLATITWGGLQTGPTGISISVEGTMLSDPDGLPITVNSIVVPAITIMEGGDIEGVVLRQGTAGGNGGTEVSAFAASDGMLTTTHTVGNGSFLLSSLDATVYTVHATYPGYLRAQKASVYVVGSTVNVGTTTLYGGDVNADNCVNILDIVSIIGWFGTTGLPNHDPYDINNDGTVNILDLTIAAGNFTRCGPTTW
jgi:hypothetical protein